MHNRFQGSIKSSGNKRKSFAGRSAEELSAILSYK